MIRTTNTILFVPGLWLTPDCWHLFREHYEARGYNVIFPPWPGMSEDSASDSPSPLRYKQASVAEIVDHYESLIRCFDEEPFLIGHGLGGLIVQLLLNRGRGVAGIAIGGVPPQGIYRVSRGTLMAFCRLLVNPLTFWRAVPLPFVQFRENFAHTMADAEARGAYRSYVVPASGRALFDISIGALIPRSRNRVKPEADQRAPLLLVAGADDRLVSPSTIRANYAWYKSRRALTAYKEFPGRSHLMVVEKGWEEIADYCLNWVEAATSPTHTSRVPVTAVRNSYHQSL